MNKKISFSAALGVLALVVVSGCSADKKDRPTGTDTVTIAYAGIDESIPLYRSLGDGLQAIADKNGDKLVRFDNAQDPTKSLSNAQLIAQQKPDVVIDWSAGSNDALGRSFTRADIPCIAVNLPIAGCPLFNLDQIGFGNQLGAAAAEIAENRGWTGSEMTVMLVAATGGGPDPIQNVGGFYQTFAEAFPELDQMKGEDFTLTTTRIGNSGVVVDGGGTVDKAYSATQAALQSIPPNKKLVVDVINDSMALGVLRAIDQAGRTDDTIIISTGAESPALAELRDNPSWVVEGALGLQEWPEYVSAMAKAVLAGVTLPDVTVTPFQVLTKDNLSTYYNRDDAISKLPVPDSATYLENYGLAR